MAFLECRFFSEALRLSTSMSVILPQQTSAAEIGTESVRTREEFPVLYLLHGLSDDHSIWSRRTSIERYATRYGLVVVMPEVHRSFYINLRHGAAYWDFIAEELPEICAGFFPISRKPEATFACGFSMGGYGAFKLALARGEKFGAAVSLSGALDLDARLGASAGPEREGERIAAFGHGLEISGTDNDLFHLARTALREERPIPPLLQHCGRDDYLYPDNQKFRHFAEELGLPLHYEESEGSHNWDYVDRAVQRALAWLPIPEAA